MSDAPAPTHAQRGIAMAGSSLIVAVNAVSLKRLRPPAASSSAPLAADVPPGRDAVPAR